MPTTYPDSRILHTADGYVQGYNGQAACIALGLEGKAPPERSIR